MKMYQQSLMYMLIQMPHHYQVKLLMKKQSTMVNGLTDQSLKIKLDFDEIPPISVAAKRFL